MDPLETSGGGNGRRKGGRRLPSKKIGLLIEFAPRTLRKLAHLQAAMIVQCGHDLSRDAVINEAISAAAKQKVFSLDGEEIEA